MIHETCKTPFFEFIRVDFVTISYMHIMFFDCEVDARNARIWYLTHGYAR
jgi:hypothetical protein